MDASEPGAFYDELAPYHDLIFVDWEATMQRQGDAIARLLEERLPDATAPIRILDAAAGIGTQSLPLAGRGFRVSSRDVSAAAIARLQREASSRGIAIDAAVADMRTSDVRDSQFFDAVLAFDNAVPHLLTDDDLLTAFRSFYAALRPGGLCLLSVRDYDEVERGADAAFAYGVRWRGGLRYLPFQAWHWVTDDCYDMTFYFIVDEPAPRILAASTTRYYAVSPARLLSLLAEAGFTDCQRLDGVIYQPVLVGHRPALSASG